MKSTLLISFSLRNYLRNYNRYIILLISISVVVCLFFTSATLSDGMQQSIVNKAKRYHSGDLMLQAYQIYDSTRLEVDPTVIDPYIISIRNNVDFTSKRSLYLNSSRLFFNGQYITQRRLIGVSWEEEEQILKDFFFTSGGIPQPDNTEAILISTTIADSLNIKVGDQVVISANVSDAQINTHTFIVHGIFNESSIFSFASYVHVHALNTFANRPIHYINEVGIRYTENTSELNKMRFQKELWNSINQNFDILPTVNSRIERDAQVDTQDERREAYLLINLNAQLSELFDLITAIQIITFTILLIFSILIFIGVFNTFSLMMTERKKEIASMRSLGAQKMDVVKIFLLEGIFLICNGIFLGLLLAIIVLFQLDDSLSNIDLPYLSLILTNDMLLWSITPSNTLLCIVIVTVASFMGIFKVVYKTSKEFPIKLLNE